MAGGSYLTDFSQGPPANFSLPNVGMSSPSGALSSANSVVGGSQLGTPGTIMTLDQSQALTAFHQVQGQAGPTLLSKTTVKPTKNTKATTPTKKAPSPLPVPDAYRKGLGIGTPTNPNELAQPRQLSTTTDTPGVINVNSRISQAAGNKDPIVNAYARFFLDKVTVVDQEKYQITETFTSFYVFMFGRRPRIYNFSGYLLNDPNYRWTNDFKYYYENFFRGTAAADLDADVVMVYDSNNVNGIMLNFQMQTNSINPKGVPFSMDMLVFKHDTGNYFSLDMQQLIDQKAKELQNLKESIASQLAMISKNTPSTTQQKARKVAAGTKAPSAVALKGVIDTTPTPSTVSFARQTNLMQTDSSTI